MPGRSLHLAAQAGLLLALMQAAVAAVLQPACGRVCLLQCRPATLPALAVLAARQGKRRPHTDLVARALVVAGSLAAMVLPVI